MSQALTRRGRLGSAGPGRPAPGPVIVGLAVVGVGFLVVPLLVLLASAPWGSMIPSLTSRAATDALVLSAVTASLATAGCLLVGVPLAILLAKSTARGIWIIRALVVLPLVLPPVVGGTALLMAFGRNSFLGGWLYSTFGWQLPFTAAGVVAAEMFVALPFLVLTVEAALRAHGQRYDQAAATLGADRWRTFRMVTLPMIAPAIVAGAVLSFARALGEFGATITFAGNFPGTTQTLPLAIYGALESDPETAIALSVLLLGFTATALALLRGRVSGWGQR